MRVTEVEIRRFAAGIREEEEKRIILMKKDCKRVRGVLRPPNDACNSGKVQSV